MNRHVALRAEAFAHMAEAFSWYQRQRPGLGWLFLEDLEAVFALLAERPEAGPDLHRGVRRVLLRRFPYVVYYQVAAQIEVRAILHTRQRPRRWRIRA